MKHHDNYTSPAVSDKMDKYLSGNTTAKGQPFDKTLKDAAGKADKKQKENEKGMMGESEDTVGTMAYNNYAPQKVGDIGQQPLRVGRSSPSMSRRQRSWNLGFISDVLENEGLMTGDLRREIATRLARLG